MLQTLRSSVASIFVKVLFGLLVLSFAVWGMGDIFGGGFFGRDTVAEVGDVKISATQLDNEYRREVNRLRSMNIDPERARQLGVMDRLLQSMINRATFDAEVGNLGIVASNQAVADNIRDNPAFRNELGRFDRIRFEQLLQANGISQASYEEDLRQDIARSQVVDSVAGSTRVPKPVADAIYAWRQGKRVAGVLQIPVASDASVPEPSDAKLAEFYQQHSAKFTAPERRSIRFVHLSPTESAKSVDVPEEALTALFAERKTELSTPEKRKVLQMVTADEATAKSAAQRILLGEPFADVAKAVSGQTAEGVNLGEVTRADLPEELAEKVFAIDAGAISPPLQGPFGWHLFKVEKIIPRREAVFAEVKDQLRAEIAGEKAIEVVYEKANKLEDAIGSGATLAEAATSLNLELRKIETLDRQGRDAGGKPIENLPGPPFLETVFSMTPDSPGTLTETQAGGFFLARVDAVTPSAVLSLTEARQQVIDEWKQSKRVSMAEAKAESVKTALESGAAPGDIPEASGKALEITEPFTRENGPARTNLPFQIVDDLFKFENVGQVTTAFAGDRFVVAVLKDIVPADPQKDPDGYRNLAMNLNSSLTSDLLVQYNRALQEEHGLTINETLLNKLKSSDN